MDINSHLKHVLMWLIAEAVVCLRYVFCMLFVILVFVAKCVLFDTGCVVYSWCYASPSIND